MEPDKILVGRFKELIVEHEEIANKYRHMLAKELGNTVADTINLDITKTVNKQQTNKKPVLSKKHTAKKLAKEKAIVIAYCARINTMPTANQLRDEINAKTGKTITQNSFYAMLTELKKDTVTIHTIDGNPIASKFLYALKDWHNVDGTLKEEYLLKAKAGHQGQLL